ncbi:MAG TPA: threonine synthase [Candidatus Krumholzibacteria bacterium]|nr:threonine synthase [Candidatus Krumholzibacteria bacterium]
MSLLSHLECSQCGRRYDADALRGLCDDCRRPLLARYDLRAAARAIDRAAVQGRARDVWRFHELQPVRDPDLRLSLGEGGTPLVRASRLATALGFSRDAIFIKDEGPNPTGSFKARGMAVAVSRALELGARVLTAPSAGNAGCALAAYAARAGVEAHVYMPADVPASFTAQCRAYGARIHLIDGLITDCGRASIEDAARFGRFDLSTLKEPYRLEGKKTLGYELAEQSGWNLPDVIVYPTGGGTGLVGMWKAFDEMEALGWIDARRPRMVSVQASGCAPIVRAFDHTEDTAAPWEDASTVADGLRVPAAVGDVLMLRSIRESKGTAIAVTDEDLMNGAETIARAEGIFAAPEGGATVAAYTKLRARGWIREGERTVLFNTGSGLSYAHLWSDAGRARLGGSA